MLRFVEGVTKHAYRTTNADVQALRDHGWSEPQIAECVYVAALFALFNRVADAFGLEDPHYFDDPPARGGDRLSTTAVASGTGVPPVDDQTPAGRRCHQEQEIGLEGER